MFRSCVTIASMEWLELEREMVQTRHACHTERMGTLNKTGKDFKGRHFNQNIILLCVRCYVTYKLSYGDLFSE